MLSIHQLSLNVIASAVVPAVLQVDHVKAERNVLAEVHNPHIVRLFYSFQVRALRWMGQHGCVPFCQGAWAREVMALLTSSRQLMWSSPMLQEVVFIAS